jgi:molybdopterin biosynthesis enzyme
VVTGTEIYAGLIEDGFDRHVGSKLSAFGCEFRKKFVRPDDSEMIADALLQLRDLGCDLIIITGGLSVDPDDVTRVAVHRAGAEIIIYGSPVLPGAMFLYARLAPALILGLPACVYYFKTTIFDIVLPRVLAGEPVDQDFIAELGHGGLCLNCSPCRFPACSFGR